MGPHYEANRTEIITGRWACVDCSYSARLTDRGKDQSSRRASEIGNARERARDTVPRSRLKDISMLFSAFEKRLVEFPKANAMRGEDTKIKGRKGDEDIFCCCFYKEICTVIVVLPLVREDVSIKSDLHWNAYNFYKIGKVAASRNYFSRRTKLKVKIEEHCSTDIWRFTCTNFVEISAFCGRVDRALLCRCLYRRFEQILRNLDRRDRTDKRSCCGAQRNRVTWKHSQMLFFRIEGDHWR